MERTKVYISGGITGVKNYAEAFYSAEDYLRKALNVDVINPVRVEAALPEMRHEEYLMIDKKLIEIADIIFLLDGWEKSRGAREEVKWAISLDKEIITDNRRRK